MVFDVDYIKNNRTYTMIDIEIFLRPDDYDKCQMWYTEIYCNIIPEGLVHFIKDKIIQDDFDYEEFIKDIDDLKYFRTELNIKYDNSPKNKNDASNAEIIFVKILEEKIKNFVNKYDLTINID